MSRSDQKQLVVKRYFGNEQKATWLFQSDATKMVATGYYPTGQTWAPGAWGCGAFLVALLLCLVFIGFLVFVYMLVVKPDGTLTVTYELREAEKTCPKCAEHVKAAATVCRFCGHSFS